MMNDAKNSEIKFKGNKKREQNNEWAVKYLLMIMKISDENLLCESMHVL